MKKILILFALTAVLMPLHAQKITRADKERAEGLVRQMTLEEKVNFIAGAVDATLARSYDEYYQLLQTRIIQPDTGIYRFEDHEYNVQQEGVYVTRAYYQTHRAQAEAFARASRRGWEWADEHPQETLDLVMRYVREFRIPTNRTLQELMLKEVIRLQHDHDSGEKEFRLRPDMVDKANEMMEQAGMISRRITCEDLLP